jgi:dihydrofolate reductase
MRKVIWLIHPSLDGFVSGPNGDSDGAGASMDDELWAEVGEPISTVDAALFGRLTSQSFEGYRPALAGNPSSANNELDFSRWIDNPTKSVASTTLNRLDWQNSILLNHKVAEGVLKMKGQSGNNRLLFGSPSLASHLSKASVIDELRLHPHPVTLGAGPARFNDRTERHR